MIADAEGPIAIAGVIGGLDSAIGPETKRIVLESAYFQAASVRKTSVALKLRTDASMRFEKSQDPVNTVRGLARALELLQQVSPGIRLVGGTRGPKSGLQDSPPPIELSVDWLQRKARPRCDCARSGPRQFWSRWNSVSPKPRPEHFSVTVPSWRATKDISIKDDLLEEVGRMLGYDSITPQAPLVESVVPPANPSRDLPAPSAQHGRGAGIHRSLTTTRSSAKRWRARSGCRRKRTCAYRNPIASDQTLMRLSLLPGIRQEYSRKQPAPSLVPICSKSAARFTRRGEQLPEEIPHFAAAMYTRDGDGGANLFELKRLAECLMPGCEVRRALRAALRTSRARGGCDLARSKPPAVFSSCIHRLAWKAARRSWI